MNNFNDFAEPINTLDGDKISIDEVLGKEIIVKKFRITKSKYKRGNEKCLTIQVEIEGKTRVIFSGSGILQDQLNKYSDKLPFTAKIIKPGTYYTFS